MKARVFKSEGIWRISARGRVFNLMGESGSEYFSSFENAIKAALQLIVNK